MATVLERLQHEKQVIESKAAEEVAAIEAKIAALPAEVHALEEAVWDKIKAFLGVA